MATNKPYFENRSGTDVAGLQAALVRYTQQLQRYLDDREVAIIQEATQDSAGVASTTGSIFSMTGPLGAAAPVVAYDFTRFDEGLTDAQNLVNANQSGNSNLDLTAVGIAEITYLSFNNNTGAASFGWIPFASSADGGALMTGRQLDYVVTTTAPAELRFLGAMTVEWCGYITEPPGAVTDMFMWDFSAAGETEAANVLYMLFLNSLTWRFLSESGAGVDSSVSLFQINTLAELNGAATTPVMITIARSVLGIVTIYINGRLALGGQATVLPTGGTTSNLSLGFGAPASKAAILGFRAFNVELTPVQVQESYRRTFFGAGAAA